MNEHSEHVARTRFPHDDDPRLDWVPAHDHRSLNFGFADVAPADIEEAPRRWRCGSTLNQAREGACVSFGWTQEAISSPRPNYSVTSHFGSNYAFQRFQRIRAIDRAMGNVWDDGASVLAGAKSAVELGHIESYRWGLRGIEDARAALLTEGPVVIGIPWYESMYDTYGRNATVEVSGALVGGHCILLDEYHPGKHVATPRGLEVWRGFGWHNSWGDGYGRSGRGFIRAEDLRDLLAQWGELCIPIGRRRIIL